MIGSKGRRKGYATCPLGSRGREARKARLIVPVAGAFFLVVAVGYGLWSPGADIRDGRHDRGENGIWVGHGWLGSDDWFRRNGKTGVYDQFRSPEAIRNLHATLRRNHITDVFPHLCPAESNGSIPGIDRAQAHRLIEGLPGIRILPWVGGVQGRTVALDRPKWRAAFTASATALLSEYPFQGIHVNIEPCPSGEESFLKLLDELRAAMPPGKILSVAAYPPPSLLHPFVGVHWDRDYFHEVAVRCDQMAVMMYDTALRSRKLFINLVRSWTRACLQWSGSTPVLLGVPTYRDEGVGYHVPRVENLANALLGINRGLTECEYLPANFQGVAIYCLWETDEEEWLHFAEHFLRH